MTMNDPQKRLEARLARLREEQSYIRPGWHVRVRTVWTERRSFSLSLKEWLMYPLFSARV
jgi:hypothetical protein